MSTALKKLPGVLAFKRCHVISDAEMFSLVAGSEIPVAVVRHGIRGTQNVAKKKVASDAPPEISNPQITETAKLDPRAEALVVRFHVALLDLASALDACVGADRNNAKMLRASFDDFVSRAKDSEGLLEIARRYARNIANGRWLWRNRSIAAAITIKITNRRGEELATFDAKQIPLNHFRDYLPGEHVIAEELARQLRGKSEDGLIVEAVVTPRVLGNVEVFPSQNYIERKPKGFARPLYKLGHPDRVKTEDPSEFTDTRITGHAALRDQKLFNAIRTIDTWYPEFQNTGFPIPVEPKGANLEQQEFYRDGKASSFELFKRLTLIDPNSEEGMFCIAALDRGGVYGESDKDDKAASAAQKAADTADAEEME